MCNESDSVKWRSAKPKNIVLHLRWDVFFFGSILFVPFFSLFSSFRLNQKSFVYSQVDAVGWGKTSFGGPVSTALQKVQLTVIPNEECNKNYPYQITSAQMCTFTPLKDTCDVSIVATSLSLPFYPSAKKLIFLLLSCPTHLFFYFCNSVRWRRTKYIHGHIDRTCICQWSW